MKYLIQSIRDLFPQPAVLDRQQIERATFWRSVFMQGMYGAGFPSWKDVAEVDLMKERAM